MKRLFLAAGAAALAITVPAVAKPDGGNGHKGHAKEQNAPKAKSNGGNKGDKARGNRSAKQAQKMDRGPRQAQKADRGKDRQKAVKQARQANEKRFEQRQKMAEKRVERGQKMAQERNKARRKFVESRQEMAEKAWKNRDRQVERMAERRIERVRDADWNRDWDGKWDDREFRRAFADGCPPGLAKKPVRCMPPGHAKELLGEPLNVLSQRVALRDLPDRLRYVYNDTDDYYYRYGNGYAYRIDRDNDLVSALLPLFGLGLTTGQVFPSTYSNYHLPTGLQAFYPQSQYGSYRYANGYVYEIDPATGLINDVDPLLGYGHGYGQMLPMSYSAYNVPYQYRSMYYDTPDNYYRYAPGAIYQVDPQTSLITAVAALLTGGVNVGQQLPMGYSAYNVPLAYRDQYYDTGNDWYRYANGNIYRVDPATQLVTALVTSILT